MFGVLLLLLFVFDAFIVGILAAFITGLLLGDKPFARLLKLLLGIVAGGAYFYLCTMVPEFSFVAGWVVMLGPVAFVAIIWVIYYMFKNQ